MAITVLSAWSAELSADDNVSVAAWSEYAFPSVAGSNRCMVVAGGYETGSGTLFGHPSAVQVRSANDDSVIATTSTIVASSREDFDANVGFDRASFLAFFNEAAVAAVAAHGFDVYVHVVISGSASVPARYKYTVLGGVNFSSIASNQDASTIDTNTTDSLSIANNGGVLIAALLSSTYQEVVTWTAPTSKSSDQTVTQNSNTAELNIIQTTIASAETTTITWTTGTAIVRPATVAVVLEEAAGAAFSAGPASDTTPAEGDTITVPVNGAGAYTATLNGDALTIDSQTASLLTITVPNLRTFGSKSAAYNTALDIVVTDTDDSSTDTLQITVGVPSGYEVGTIASVAGLYAEAEFSGVVVGDIYFCPVIATADAANGAFPQGSTFQMWIMDVSDVTPVWGTPFDVSTPVYDPPDFPCVIESITPSPTTAIVLLSYPGADITGYEYRLDGGSWVAATSTINLSSLTASTLYALDVRPVNGSDAGSITSQNFTTTSGGADVTPNAFTIAQQTGVALNTVITFPAVTIAGVDPGEDIAITVSGGEYRVHNGVSWGSWGSAAGTGRLNYQVETRHTSQNAHSTPTASAGTQTGLLTIGGVSDNFVSVTIADTTAPDIALTGANPLSWPLGTAYSEPGYTATDNADGTLTGSVVVTGTVDTDTPGQYTLTYSVTDSSGNPASVQRVVNVASTGDTVDPVISLVGGNRSLVVGETWSDPGYTASDNVDGDLTGSVSVSGTVNTSTPGVNVLTYSVSDAAGNAGTAQRLVTVYSASLVDDFIPRLLQTDVHQVTVYAGRDNKFRVVISHDGTTVDLSTFSHFELFGLSASAISSLTNPEVFDITDGGGQMEIAAGALTTVTGVARLTLVGYSATLDDGVILFEPTLVNAHVNARVISA